MPRIDPARAEAGHLLIAACEQVLGVTGPTALGLASGRSASWWSRLSSGTGTRFPDWDELLRILPAGIAEDERRYLRERHGQACLIRHGSPLHERLAVATGTVPLDDLRCAWECARFVGHVRFDNQRARSVVRLIESQLAQRPPDTLSADELALLTGCLEDRSVFEAHLRDHPAAIAAAERAARYQRLAGNREAELHCLHSIGIAYYRAARYDDALRQLQAVNNEYARSGRQGELVRALRDIGATYAWMGKGQEAQHFVELSMEKARGLSPDYLYPTVLWMADVAKRRGKLEESRRWLGQMDEMLRKHPAELAGIAGKYYIRDHRRQIERHLAQREAARRAGIRR